MLSANSKQLLPQQGLAPPRDAPQQAARQHLHLQSGVEQATGHWPGARAGATWLPWLAAPATQSPQQEVGALLSRVTVLAEGPLEQAAAPWAWLGLSQAQVQGKPLGSSWPRCCGLDAHSWGWPLQDQTWLPAAAALSQHATLSGACNFSCRDGAKWRLRCHRKPASLTVPWGVGKVVEAATAEWPQLMTHATPASGNRVTAIAACQAPCRLCGMQ